MNTTPSSSMQPQSIIDEQSLVLRELYREMAEDVDARALDAEISELSEEQAKFAASQWTLIWRRFRRNKAAILGGIIVLIYYLTAVFAGFIAPYGLETSFIDPRNKINYQYLPPQRVHLFDDGKLKPFVYGIESHRDDDLLTNPNATLAMIHENTDEKIYLHFFAKGDSYRVLGPIKSDIHLFHVPRGIVSILGTDIRGRDMFSRIVWGSRLSLFIGLFGVLLSLTLGTVLGVASGYFGGLIDEIIQSLIEMVRAFPSIPLWMALSAALPRNWSQSQTYFAITIILSLIGWTWLARQLRGLVLAIRQSDYVVAARLAGASHTRIIFKHLIPATLGQIIVVATLSLPAMILAETALSFLGLGLRPPTTSWGVLIQAAQNLQTLALYPWLFSPVFAVVIVILAFSFLGDGLRDAADPYTI